MSLLAYQPQMGVRQQYQILGRAEVLLQILSFKGGSIASLLQDIESLYLHEKITQRVYVTAKLLLRPTDPPEPE